MTNTTFAQIRDLVQSAAVAVMAALGPDHLPEECYDRALQIEFRRRGIAYESQPVVPIVYEGQTIDTLRPDFFVLDVDEEAGTADRVIVEIKTMRQLTDAERAQVKAYLRHSRAERGLLINFSYAGRIETEEFI